MRADCVRTQEIQPAAARTIRSFRDIGYDLPRAIADIVDNSISASATNVDVTLSFRGSDTWIRIADDGHGMDAETLLEGMRYGSEREYDYEDLGRFGFGLKTASTSQCQRLTVASRHELNGEIEIRCLDLGHIERTNRWEVIVIDPQDAVDHLIEPIRNSPGTVVLWESLDRVLEYQDPFGGWAERRMLTFAEEIDQHLAMVFHRFLTGEVEGRRLSITVNGSDVRAWDPFCRDEPGTTELSSSDIRIASSNGLGIASVKAFVLPPQGKFSSPSAWRRASGPAKWNRQQGLYIFRANRLIQPGGWNRMRTIEEHNKLARIALDFFPDLDTAFSINIMKASVRLPEDLREHLQPIITATVREANKRYREKPTPPKPAPPVVPVLAPPATTQPVPDAPPASPPAPSLDIPASPGAPSSKPTDLLDPLQERTRSAIEDAAESVGEVDALGRIVGALVERHPEVAHDLGW